MFISTRVAQVKFCVMSLCQIADYVIDPMCRGIFAASAGSLSMQSAFPAIHRYETSYGTIVGGALMTKPGETCIHT